MKFAVVTSCSRKIYHECGREFIESFLRYWPSEARLYVVSEDSLPNIGRATFLPLKGAALDFLARHDRPRARGRVRLPNDVGWTPKKVSEGYNFRYDAFRFSKKVFAIDQVAREVGSGRLFWCDADVRTFAAPPAGLFTQLLPDNVALSCLDRGTYHSECGFVGYNLDHPRGREFVTAFADLFASDEVFKLQEWHDSWVFDWLRKKLNVPTFAIQHTSRHHPFVNSVLGSFMDHMKGARKTKGRTPAAEITNPALRGNTYWAAT